MSAKTQQAGVNAFLEAVYGPTTRLSTLLAGLGYTEARIALLRERYLMQIVDAFVTAIADRVEQYDRGGRKYFVLARRFGLDGEPRCAAAATRSTRRQSRGACDLWHAYDPDSSARRDR